jgi:mannose-6-phosphate isomerase-like protein (cupin superfamily)
MQTQTSQLLPGALDEPGLDVRPSGALLGIFDLPRQSVPVAPFTLARFVVPPGISSSPDKHEVRELWVVVRGSGRLVLDDEERRVVSGDIVYFESERQHRLINDGEESVELVSIWWSP